MIRRVRVRFLARAAVAALLASAPVRAQSADEWAVGAQGTAAIFLGSSDILDAGPGLDVSVSRDVARHLRFRADGMLMLLDDQSHLTEIADNRILLLGLGPELHVALGTLELYARGLFGAAANAQVRTNSVLEERTTWARAMGVGAGLRLRLGPTVALDVGGDVLKLGELDFARTSTSSLMLLEDASILRLRAGLRFGLG